MENILQRKATHGILNSIILAFIEAKFNNWVGSSKCKKCSPFSNGFFSYNSKLKSDAMTKGQP